MVEVSKSAPAQNSTGAPPTSGVSSSHIMGGKKEADGENGVSVMILSDREDGERKRVGNGGRGGEVAGGTRQERSDDRDSSSTRSGTVCCNEGRAWIFLVLGVLTLVFSAVLIGIYMNMRTLTSSMHHVEVMPSYIPAVVGAVAALSVLLLFWKRAKPLMYLVLFLCASATILCIITAVMTGTRVMQPILSVHDCLYTRSTRSCRCVVKDGDSTSGPPTSITMKDIAGCSVVKDILPNMLFTLVGIYGVIALVCAINGLISLLVCRMELNRKRMQALDYGANYSTSPTSSSESILEQQTMLPSQQQQPQSATSTQNASSVAIIATTSTITTPASSGGDTLANIYTNANAIDDVNAADDKGGEGRASDAAFTSSDLPVGFTETSLLKRSQSFNQPRRSTFREGSPQSSSSTTSHDPSSVMGGASDEEKKLIPKRRKNRRAVTLHGLDRDQLMLILSLQMRYLQETDQDSKKPDNYAMDTVTTSANDITATATDPDSSTSSDSTDPPPAVKAMEGKKSISMKDVIAGNIHGGIHTNQAFVSSGQIINERMLQQGLPVQQSESNGEDGGSSAFIRMQRRAMTPTPHQERLSSCRTTDDEMEFLPSKLVRSHTPQPHHFRSEHQFQHQEQQVLEDEQRHQYLLKLQQEYQYWSLEQQLQQQQRIQELQFQNMKQKQELLLQQQQQQVQRQQQQQLFNGLPPQQHPLNQQYHQIIQQQLRQTPFAGNHSETVSSSTLENVNGPTENDEPATHITIDLRDITKTGPVIYENAPPSRALNLISHSTSNTNSISSLPSTSSTLRGTSSSPQPKSILVNKGAPIPIDASSQVAVQGQPPEPQASVMRQISNTSNQSLLSSSGNGSISSEIQKAFNVDAKDGDKNEDKDGGKVKWTKKLSMKLKRDKKDKDKDKGKFPDEVEEVQIVNENEDKMQPAAGLARSDSDVRRSGVFPDRWQAIMVDSAVQQAPQTLWENVQRKIVTDPEAQPAGPINPPPYPGRSQVPVPPTYTNVSRNVPQMINGNPYASGGQYSNLPSNARQMMPPGQLQQIPPTSMYPSSIPPFRPALPLEEKSVYQGQQTQPLSRPVERNIPPSSAPQGQTVSDHTFLPITTSQSPFIDDYAIEGRTSSKPNLRRSNSLVDPNAPPKPPRRPELSPNNVDLPTDVQGQPQRPKSYVKAVTKDAMERSPQIASSNNSSMLGEDLLVGGLAPRSAAVRMQMEGPVRSEFGRDNSAGPRKAVESDGYYIPMKFNGDQGQSSHPYGNGNTKDNNKIFPLSPRQQHKFVQPRSSHQIVGEAAGLSNSNQDPSSNQKAAFHPFIGPTYPPPGHAICDTDLDELPTYRPGRGRYQVQSSRSPPPPPPYASPPIYRSMESVTRNESLRSTSSSSSEPHNTSCSLSEPHNTSYTLSDPHNSSSDRSFTPPLRPEFPRLRPQVPGGVLSQGHLRGRPLQPRGRNLSLGNRHRSPGSRFSYRSPTITAYPHEANASSSFGSTPPLSHAQAPSSEPYVLMRRCQSEEDKGRHQNNLYNNNYNGNNAYGSGRWPKGHPVNNNNNNNNNNISSISSSSSNGDVNDVVRFPPSAAMDIRRHGETNTSLIDHDPSNVNLRKKDGQFSTNQEREIRPMPPGMNASAKMTNFQQTSNGNHLSRSVPGNNSLPPSNGNFHNGPPVPPRPAMAAPYGFAPDDFGRIPSDVPKGIANSWDSADDGSVNRPLRKLTLSGSEEIVGYMAGMDGVSPDSDDVGYAESVI